MVLSQISLSILCILVEIFLVLMQRGQKILNGFKFGTFIGRFPSDSTASMALKELNFAENAKNEAEHETWWKHPLRIPSGWWIFYILAAQRKMFHFRGLEQVVNTDHCIDHMI